MINVLKGLDNIIDDIKPYADTLGVGPVVRLVDTVLEIGTSVLDRVTQGVDVLASDDEAYVRDLLTRLRAENKSLNEKIKDS